eukprot:GHVN01017089.1.p1 GENE.GHVN01017089.1~~GHVN01017089.1.p1  ORF type:complete len:1080 (-),score=119.94 GHVN01017089.1:183-3422(-)
MSTIGVTDVISIAQEISFGVYDAIFKWWKGDLRIVSTMGKQSMGKSFWMNHFIGTLFDMSGYRCTDGCWMSLVVADYPIKNWRSRPCLIVALDFEGLGSVERTPQEDKMLNILNAGISSLTVFRAGPAADRDTKTTFQKLQASVGTFPDDPKLFKGALVIAPKDVVKADRVAVQEEFAMKLKEWVHVNGCAQSDNFISLMFRDGVRLSAFASITDNEYFSDLRNTVSRLFQKDGQQWRAPTFESGVDFSETMRVLMAKLAVSDWSSIDADVFALRCASIHSQLKSALSFGAAAMFGEPPAVLEELCDVHGSKIEDIETDEIGGFTSTKSDSGLFLCSIGDDWKVSVPRLLKKSIFLEERNGEEESLSSALVKRRCDRVSEWASSWLPENNDEGTEMSLRDLKMKMSWGCQSLQAEWRMCGHQCAKCHNKCLCEIGHADAHDCLLDDHTCNEPCVHCPENRCYRPKAHPLTHLCESGNHECGATCGLSEKVNCRVNCAQEVGHEGGHLCGSSRHLCPESCSLEGCKGGCVESHDVYHAHHSCSQNQCIHECEIASCHQKCHKDHFHSFEQMDSQHTCGRSHPCIFECEDEGICKVTSQLKTTTAKFVGLLDSFDYVCHTEQNGCKLPCCIPIPAGCFTHEGPHRHTEDPNAVHYCDRQCPNCLYYCTEPYKHRGLHNCTHGNMRSEGLWLASNKSHFSIGQHKYAQFESAKAESCDMFCRGQGRGHVHVGICVQNCSIHANNFRHIENAFDFGAKCELDESTHRGHWAVMGWRDPCSAQEQQRFSMCGANCGVHDDAEDKHDDAHFCQEAVFHSSSSASGKSWCKDGHVFSCSQKKRHHHHVLIIDASVSMQAKASENVNCTRFDLAMQACESFMRSRCQMDTSDRVSLIVFASTSSILFQDEGIMYATGRLQSTVAEFKRAPLYKTEVGTCYASAIRSALSVSKNWEPIIRTEGLTSLPTAFIFLSDGEDNGIAEDRDNLIQSLSKRSENDRFYAIALGADIFKGSLQNICNYFGERGRLLTTEDAAGLIPVFNNLAREVPRVGVLPADTRLRPKRATRSHASAGSKSKQSSVGHEGKN